MENRKLALCIQGMALIDSLLSYSLLVGWSD